MPIKPENKHLYPDNWPQIRLSILTRAGSKCERCGLPNHSIVTKADRRVVSLRELGEAGLRQDWPHKLVASTLKRMHWVRIVLTIAHLDHDPTHNEEDNLQALCQRCHNRLDMAHRAATRAATLQSKQLGYTGYQGWQMPMNLTEKEGNDDEHGS